MRASAAAIALVAVALAACSGDDGSATAVEPLVAGFEYEVDYEATSPTSCPVREIAFLDTSQGAPTEWLWTFADGSSSTEPSPTLSRMPDGSGLSVGEVTLEVRRGSAEDSITRRVEIVFC